MNILLDTHLAIWALFGDERLSKKAAGYILNPNNTIFYSVVSSWEILLKHDHDPQNMVLDAQQFITGCKMAGYLPLKLSDSHIISVSSLAFSEDAPIHKDPFDKLLIAQAKSENFHFLTHDKKLAYYREDCVILV